MKAKSLSICGHFVGQQKRVVSAGGPLKQKEVLSREDFSSEEIRGAYKAWNVVDGAPQSKVDRLVLKRFKSPREAFDQLEKWYGPESEVVPQKLYDKFHDFTIPPNSYPIGGLQALEDTNSQMAEKGMGVPDTFLHACFVRALPDEYGGSKRRCRR